jgi:hypothetical protein
MMQTAQPIGGFDEQEANGGVTISIKLFRIARPVTMLIEQKQRLSKWNSEAPRENFFVVNTHFETNFLRVSIAHMFMELRSLARRIWLTSD